MTIIVDNKINNHFDYKCSSTLYSTHSDHHHHLLENDVTLTSVRNEEKGMKNVHCCYRKQNHNSYQEKNQNKIKIKNHVCTYKENKEIRKRINSKRDKFNKKKQKLYYSRDRNCNIEETLVVKQEHGLLLIENKCRQQQNFKSKLINLHTLLLLLSINCLFIFDLIQASSASPKTVEAKLNNIALSKSSSPLSLHNLLLNDSSSQVLPFFKSNSPSDRKQIIPNKQNNSSASTSTSTYRADNESNNIIKRSIFQQQQLNELKNQGISEDELLPLSDFYVHHPDFNDLIKIWPPTTKQHAITEPPINHHTSSSAYYQRRKNNNQMKKNNNDFIPIRNNLNEDLDDTIITADEEFELDQAQEPPSWITYLGDLGDFIYAQLKSYYSSNQQQQQDANQQQYPIEYVEELLDDYYYNQYENSQVLYFGPQLIREGDMFEIGCYMPLNQPAEWTKSGKLIVESDLMHPRVIRKNDFLGAKLNFSLKIFEATLSDSGNYRCNKMSRKYHKLVVFPKRTSATQMLKYQQNLLSIVRSKQGSGDFYQQGDQQIEYINNRNKKANFFTTNQQQNDEQQNKYHLLQPSMTIIEGQPMSVSCGVTDEYIINKLKENKPLSSQNKLIWFKNGKQLKGAYVQIARQQQQQIVLQRKESSNEAETTTATQLQPFALPTTTTTTHQSQLQSQVRRKSVQPTTTTTTSLPPQMQSIGAGGGVYYQSSIGNYQPSGRASVSRIQFRSSGLQMVILSAQYSDAGDYLCSWYKLPPPPPPPMQANPMRQVRTFS